MPRQPRRRRKRAASTITSPRTPSLGNLDRGAFGLVLQHLNPRDKASLARAVANYAQRRNAVTSYAANVRRATQKAELASFAGPARKLAALMYRLGGWFRGLERDRDVPFKTTTAWIDDYTKVVLDLDEYNIGVNQADNQLVSVGVNLRFYDKRGLVKHLWVDIERNDGPIGMFAQEVHVTRQLPVSYRLYLDKVIRRAMELYRHHPVV